jgi:hypothetical protein
MARGVIKTGKKRFAKNEWGFDCDEPVGDHPVGDIFGACATPIAHRVGSYMETRL